MNAARPVKLEDMFGRIVGCIDDDLVEHCSENPVVSYCKVVWLLMGHCNWLETRPRRRKYPQRSWGTRSNPTFIR